MPALATLVDAVAGRVPQQDIEIMRGDDETIVFEFRYRSSGRLRDWTGWTFTSEVRASIGGTLRSTGVVTHNGTGGQIQVVYPANETALLVPGVEGVYDVQGVDSGLAVHTVVRGVALFTGDITA